MIGVAWSLGANVLVKSLGEQAEKSPFSLVFSISNPLDFLASSEYMKNGWIQRKLYSRGLVSGLLEYAKRHKDMFLKIKGIDYEKLLLSKSVYEFDSRATTIAFGYDSVEDYYKAASSSQFLPKVRVPLLLINAPDDPIIPLSAIPFDKSHNDNVVFMITQTGGHCGFKDFRFCTWVDSVVVDIIKDFLSQK